ncbi:MAG: hypothetical protein R3B68_09480 [Phycisphaerales bacterium]
MFSGTNPGGRRETSEIVAASSAAALLRLDEDGWTGVTLHTDEFIRLDQEPGLPRLTPKERVAILAIRPETLWKFRVGFLWSRAKWAVFTPLVCGTVLGMLWWNRGPRASDLMLALCVVVPLGWMLWVLLSPDPAAPHNRVLRANLEGRWADALAAMPRLERLMAKIPAGRNGVEAARLRAGPLIRLGRVDEAFAVVRALEGRPDVPRAQYLSVLAEAHTGVRDFDAAEACYTQIVEDHPDTPMWWVALAEFQALRRGRPDAARESLACVESAGLVPPLVAYVWLIEGVIAVLEGDDRGAVGRLGEAHEAVSKSFPNMSSRRAILAFCDAFRAVALARLGDRAAAADIWAGCERIIELHGSDVPRRVPCAYPRARSLRALSGFVGVKGATTWKRSDGTCEGMLGGAEIREQRSESREKREESEEVAARRGPRVRSVRRWLSSRRVSRCSPMWSARPCR